MPGTYATRAGLLQLAVRTRAMYCALRRYRKVAVPAVMVSGEIISYSSPESTYAVTKRYFDAARRSILIGIYDFTASYIEELVVAALARGVKVSLLLDLWGTPETTLFRRLVRKGIVGSPAPSCTGRNRYFTNFHEKVIVIDDEWSLVQSGNYSYAGVPENVVDGGDPRDFQSGNRDMGIAVHSSELAAFFTARFQADLRLARGTRSRLTVRGPEIAGAQLLAVAPPRPPVERFSSHRFRPKRAVRVQPMLTPDNYLDAVPAWLASAIRSIYVEMQYIRSAEAKVRVLLAAIKGAQERRPLLDVRLVVAAPLNPDNLPQERRELRLLAREYGLALGTTVRVLNPRYFTHCHNKLVIVDRRAVLVGSQNWSNSALSTNREASLLIEYPALARRLTRIFLSDWETALRTLPTKPLAKVGAAAALARDLRTVTLDSGDYQPV